MKFSGTEKVAFTLSQRIEFQLELALKLRSRKQTFVKSGGAPLA
jgi:hypothetical protein